MSSPQLEEFLARLYTDKTLREQFLRDPKVVASACHLTEEEVTSMCNIDRAGLHMASDSFALKRAGHQRRSRSLRKIFSVFLRHLTKK